MTRVFSEAELLDNRQSDLELGNVEAGTVGWSDDKDHFDVAPSEVALVKVTLFRGRNPDRDPEPPKGRAGGIRILARISAPMNQIPPDGAEVMVAIPAGFKLTPGVACIIAQPAVTPPNQFSQERSKLDFGPDVDLVIKARSVTLTDYEDRYLTVGPRFGIKMGDADANGCQLKGNKWSFWAADGADEPESRAFFQLDGAGEARLVANDPSKGTHGIKFKDGNCTIPCQQFSVPAGGGKLGAGAIAGQGVGYGVGAASLMSTSWFIQA
jgi:hypothetical protein